MLTSLLRLLFDWPGGSPGSTGTDVLTASSVQFYPAIVASSGKLFTDITVDSLALAGEIQITGAKQFPIITADNVQLFA